MSISLLSLALAAALPTPVNAPQTNQTETQSHSGVFRSEYPLMSAGGEGTIKVKLILANNGTAKLSLFQEGVSKISEADVQQYGTLLRSLSRDNSIQQTGKWKLESGMAVARFTRLVASGKTTRASTFIEFRKQGEDMMTSDYTRAFYGKKFSMSLTRSLGEVAESDSYKQQVGSTANATVGGNGTLKFGNGDRVEITNLDLKMNKAKTFNMRLSGDSTVDLSGIYVKSANNYQLTIRQMWVKGRMMAGRGTGTVTMNPSGNMMRKFSFSVQMNNAYKSASMVFNPTNR